MIESVCEKSTESALRTMGTDLSSDAVEKLSDMLAAEIWLNSVSIASDSDDTGAVAKLSVTTVDDGSED